MDTGKETRVDDHHGAAEAIGLLWMLREPTIRLGCQGGPRNPFLLDERTVKVCVCGFLPLSPCRAVALSPTAARKSLLAGVHQNRNVR